MGGSLTFAPVLDSDACWDDIEEVAREDDANARVGMSPCVAMPTWSRMCRIHGD